MTNITDKEKEQLAVGISQAILSVLNQVFSKPVEDVIETLPKITKKRGRPRKQAALVDIPANTILKENILLDEPIEDILSYEPPKVQPSTTKMAAKRVNWRPPGDRGDNMMVRAEPILTKGRKQKFIDLGVVPPDVPAGKPRNDPKYYPEYESELDRVPVEKMKFECARCHRSFEAYPSEVPQAFTSFSSAQAGVMGDKPLVRCEACSTMPI